MMLSSDMLSFSAVLAMLRVMTVVMEMVTAIVTVTMMMLMLWG